MSTYYNPWYYYNAGVLVKNKKPCIPGSQVHISDMEGCFTVLDVKIDHFVVMKKRKEVKIPWDRFICLKGEGTSLEAQTKRGLRSALYQIESAQYNSAMLAKELTSFLKSLKKKTMAKKEKVTLQELIVQTPELKSPLLKFENVKLQLDKVSEACMKIKVIDQDSLYVAENNMGKINDFIKVVEKTRKDEKQPYLEKGQAIDAAAAYVSESSELALKHLKDEKIAYVKVVEAENKRKKDIQDSIEKTKHWCGFRLEMVKDVADCDYCIDRINELPNRKFFYQEFFNQIQIVINDYTRLFNLKKQELSAVSPDELEAIKEVQAEIKQNIESSDLPVLNVEVISKVRRPWTYEVVDINLVPKEFLMVDESKVKGYLKANSDSLEDGKVVNGIKYYRDLKVTV